MRGYALIALLAAFCLEASPALAFRNFRVPSSSMMPALGPGDIVTAALYGLDYEALARGEALGSSEDPRFAPKRGDIAFFNAPDGTAFVMRIVGIGGDRVQMVRGVLHLNGEALSMVPVGAVEEACSEDETCTFFRETLPGEGGAHVVMSQEEEGMGDNTQEFTVPDGHFFVMGDNRDNAADSRFGGGEFGMVGFVPRVAMIGRLHAILYSPRVAPSTAERIGGFPSLR